MIQFGSLFYTLLSFQFLDALELSQSPMLLQLMTEILCRDQRHFMEDLFQASFKRISRRCVWSIAFYPCSHGISTEANVLLLYYVVLLKVNITFCFHSNFTFVFILKYF